MLRQLQVWAERIHAKGGDLGKALLPALWGGVAILLWLTRPTSPLLDLLVLSGLVAIGSSGVLAGIANIVGLTSAMAENEYSATFTAIRDRWRRGDIGTVHAVNEIITAELHVHDWTPVPDTAGRRVRMDSAKRRRAVAAQLLPVWVDAAQDPRKFALRYWVSLVSDTADSDRVLQAFRNQASWQRLLGILPHLDAQHPQSQLALHPDLQQVMPLEKRVAERVVHDP